MAILGKIGKFFEAFKTLCLEIPDKILRKVSISIALLPIRY